MQTSKFDELVKILILLAFAGKRIFTKPSSLHCLNDFFRIRRGLHHELTSRVNVIFFMIFDSPSAWGGELNDTEKNVFYENKGLLSADFYRCLTR